ncbi:MAG: Fic family protein [Bacteroidales bacterium]|nr:Fic family protein [Bacteroidales bacterium]
MNELEQILQEIDVLKSELSVQRPLPKVALDKIQHALDIEYTYDSNRIEGNTLTMQETELVVSEGLTIGGKTMREHLEAINHKEAIDFIREIANKDDSINRWLILQIHAIILRGIDRDNAGRFRTVPVLISGSRHTPPQPYLIEKQMEDFLCRYQEMETVKEHPIKIAAYLHDELVRIHPFIDGNGRTSRLLMNLYLLRHGYVIVSLKGDAESKIAYYKALEISHVDGNSEPFVMLVANSEKESLQRYLNLLQ